MKKNDLIGLKKRIIGYSALALASTLPLSGCGQVASNATSVEISDSDEYDEYCVNSPLCYVIKVQNIDGSTKKHLVYLESMKALAATDKELYKAYQMFNHYATLYVDVLTGDVVAIKYDTDYETTDEVYGYAIHDVLEEVPAINYVSEYYGIKETYTFEELSNMMEDVNSKEYVKEK